ncbi:DgyrCDS3705 [Dimorphilus gyrociliatus]|uniref:DgyrCDS3705 n=1 Tax=Dimorphilus gyrociliatus TaxID=2664684 RepID=A0A7I8VE53_9ANNE|nr:DgyrCDS3705 [Dimorphilus gyrociliatus]
MYPSFQLDPNQDLYTHKIFEDPEEKALDRIHKLITVAERDTQDMAASVASLSLNGNQKDLFFTENAGKLGNSVKTFKSSFEQPRVDKKVLKKKKVEKLSLATEAYEKEVSNLQREIILLRRSLKKAENEANKYKLSSSEYEEKNIKLDRRLVEIKAELNREISVRKSLEEAHESSQKRFQEVEYLSSTEKENLTRLSVNCSTLKQEILRAQYETSTEKQKRIILETTLETTRAERDNISQRYEQIQEEREKLIIDLEKLKDEYLNVNEQLEKVQKASAESSSRDSHLEKALKDAAAHNAKLIAECEENAEKARKYSQHSNNHEALKKQLTIEVRAKNELLKKIKEYESILNERNMEIDIMRNEQEMIIKDKDSALNEVGETLDHVVRERQNADSQIDELVEELKRVEKQRDNLLIEIKQLRERISNSFQHSRAQEKLEKTLKDLTEQKQRLSYEKGRLESRVESLQKEMENSSKIALYSLFCKLLRIIHFFFLFKVLRERKSTNCVIQFKNLKIH